MRVPPAPGSTAAHCDSADSGGNRARAWPPPGRVPRPASSRTCAFSRAQVTSLILRRSRPHHPAQVTSLILRRRSRPSSCAGGHVPNTAQVTSLIMLRRSRPSSCAGHFHHPAQVATSLYCAGHVPPPALGASVERVTAASARQTRRAARPTGPPPGRPRVRRSRPSRTSRVPHPARAQCPRAGRCPRRASRRRPAGWPVPAHGGGCVQGWQGRSPTRAPRPTTPGKISDPRPATHERPGPPGPARTFVKCPARTGHLSGLGF